MKEDAKTSIITTEPHPDMSEREAQEWTDAQIPYPNLAGNKEIAKRALEYSNAVLSQNRREMRGKIHRWRWLDYMLRGNSVETSTAREVHVPELLRALLSIRSRVVDSVVGTGRRFFETAGRDSLDRHTAEAISGLLEWDLEQQRWHEQVEPAANSIIKYEVVCWKIDFQRTVERIPYHEVESINRDGHVVYRHKRGFRNSVTYQGNKWRLIDPYRLVVDLNRYHIDDLNYIGDISEPTIEELRMREKISGGKEITNLDQLIDHRDTLMSRGGEKLNRGQGGFDINRAVRSGTSYSSQGIDRGIQHGIWRPTVFDMACWFDLYGDGHYRKCLITTAEKNVVLRVQELPRDDKKFPYALGRVSANGFEFFEQGVLEPAIRLNAEMDHHRANVLQASDLISSPQLFAEGESDLPRSIYDARPGTVHKNAGKLQWYAPPNTLGSAPYIEDMLRRNVEEVTGAPRFDESAGNLATDTNQRVIEGNRRMLSIVRGLSMAIEQGLHLSHANWGQFMTDKVKFRVLDKRRAKMLGDHYDISPKEVLHAVDFTMLGLTRVQTYGLRAVNLLNFMKAFGPFIQELSSDFDIPALAIQAYQLLVGEQGEDDIVKRKSDPRDTISQEQENSLLMQGIEVKTSSGDDPVQHLEVMKREGMFAILQHDKTPVETKLAIARHMQAHKIQLEQLQAESAAASQQRVEREGLTPPPREQAAPGAGGLEQPSNGPPREDTVGKPGRLAGGIAQSDNQSM